MNPRLLSATLFPLITAAAFAQSEKPGFSVKDDIAMVRFNDPSGEAGDHRANDIKYSPDGRHVAVVTTRGLLKSDQVESTISVFDLDAVNGFLRDSRSKLPPRHVVAVISARPEHADLMDFAPAIKDLRWSPNSARLYFTGQNSLGAMQLYEARMSEGGSFRALTPPDYSVSRYDITSDTIVYGAARVGQPSSPLGERINRDALDVTGYRLVDILFSEQYRNIAPETFVMRALHVGDERQMARDIPGYSVLDERFFLYLLPFAISPDGHSLLTTMPVSNVPETWGMYESPVGFEHRRLDGRDPALTAPTNAFRPREYAVVDLASGKMTPLVDAPNARTQGYNADINAGVWSPDGSRVLITNVFMPPDSKRSKPCVVASVDVPSLHLRCLFSRDDLALPDGVGVDTVRFGPNSDEAFVSFGQGSTPHRVRSFHLRDGLWEVQPVDHDAAADSQLGSGEGKHAVIFIKQGLNDPPTLWASDSVSGASRQIWDPNPQLATLSFGEASVYHWKDANGKDWTGGLVKPVGYVSGKRYPLVIQMYTFREHEFLTDGTDPTAFAARELASAGFVVLQIRKQPNVLSDADPQTALEGYRRAIQSLSNDGLVDDQKVGVVGFSWTCWYVANALIKAPKLFAAATIADGLDNSYMQYLLFGPSNGSLHQQMEQIRGGDPFGLDQSRWIREAPGFHLDNVETPVRIEAISPSSVLQEWELYASLFMQHKPVDLIYFPEGVHIHQRPLERLESQQGNIDWLRFWLQGYQDPDPGKRAQYERWNRMKEESSSTRVATP